MASQLFAEALANEILGHSVGNPEYNAAIVAASDIARKFLLDHSECGACHGTGCVVRDSDIGTDQTCFSCDGAGYLKE